MSIGGLSEQIHLVAIKLRTTESRAPTVTIKLTSIETVSRLDKPKVFGIKDSRLLATYIISFTAPVCPKSPSDVCAGCCLLSCQLIFAHSSFLQSPTEGVELQYDS